MADKKKAAPQIATQAIWTGKERIEAGTPLPDYVSDDQRKHLKASGAVAEATEAQEEG